MGQRQERQERQHQRQQRERQRVQRRVAKANAFVAAHAHEGHAFVPICKDCPMVLLAAEVGTGPIPVALAASYMQRLRARALACPSHANEMERVLACDVFDLFLQQRPGAFRAPTHPAPGPHEEDQYRLMFVYLTCLHIAVKLVHVPRAGTYSFNYMAHRLLSVTLPGNELLRLEMHIMRMLDFKLMPLQGAAAAEPDAPADPECMDTDHTPSKRAKPDDSPTTVLECDEALMSP